MRQYIYNFSEDPIHLYEYENKNWAFCEEMHMSSFCQIMYVLSGEVENSIDEARFDVMPGDVFFVDRGIAHCLLPTKADTKVKTFNCAFLPEVLLDLHFGKEYFWNTPMDMTAVNSTALQGIHPFMRVHDQRKSILRIMEAMMEETKNKNIGYRNMLIAYLEQMILHIIRIYSRETENDIKSRKRHFETMAVIQYLEENYKKRITLQELSRKVALSPNYLCAIFKDETGRNIVDFLRDIRLERAKRMLLETDMSVERIANAIGYESAQYLRRLFVKELGVTPGAYRKEFADIRQKS